MTRAPEPTAPLPWSKPLRVAELPGRKPTRFDIAPDTATAAAIAQWADISALNALRLTGEIAPLGRRDFELRARFEAEVVQPCAITLAPVTAKLSEEISRTYIAGMEMPTGDETEMPEDDSAEPLPDVIDLAAVALEALELALPMFPRADGAELGETIATEPGIAPMRDEDTRPFANLADLLKSKENKE